MNRRDLGWRRLVLALHRRRLSLEGWPVCRMQAFKLWRTQHQPKADIIVSIVGMVPVADRTADVAGLIVPRTAARVAPARR